MKLAHMSENGCAKLRSYGNKSAKEIPVFHDIFGHLRDPDYVAPTNKKWRNNESDFHHENELVRIHKIVPIGGVDGL